MEPAGLGLVRDLHFVPFQCAVSVLDGMGLLGSSGYSPTATAHALVADEAETPSSSPGTGAGRAGKAPATDIPVVPISAPAARDAAPAAMTARRAILVPAARRLRARRAGGRGVIVWFIVNVILSIYGIARSLADSLRDLTGRAIGADPDIDVAAVGVVAVARPVPAARG
jgi:hypothetical protein